MHLLNDYVYFFFFHLTQAVLAPVMRDSFLYWPFLLSSLVIALLAWGYWRHQGLALSWKLFRGRFLGAKLWWHPSARADYRLYFTNAILFPALFGFLLFKSHDVVVWLNHLLAYSPPNNQATATSVAWKLAFTLAYFVAYDFGRFVAHSLLHDVRILWEFHKVHHSAAVLTPFTSFRAHPVDLLIMAWGGATSLGLMAWTFNQLAGSVVDAYFFMGLHVIIWFCNLVANLRHTSVWMTYGSVLGKWLISPAHHQIHHSSEARHYGCNRGFELALWDRLYGTLYVPVGPEEKFTLGLDDGTTEQWQSVRHMLLEPFMAAGRIFLGRNHE